VIIAEHVFCEPTYREFASWAESAIRNAAKNTACLARKANKKLKVRVEPCEFIDLHPDSLVKQIVGYFYFLEDET
jgi:hypothetical protein